MFFPQEMACREIKKAGARLLECVLPPASKVEDFIIVGKKGWLQREEALIDCQQDLLRREDVGR